MGDFILEIDKLVEKKEYDKALSLLNEKLNQNPDQQEWLEKRGDIYYKMEKFGEALNNYNKVIKLNKDNKMVISKAEMTLNILKFQNLDIFESTNLNLDPWLD